MQNSTVAIRLNFSARHPPLRKALAVERTFIITYIASLFLFAGCKDHQSAQAKKDTRTYTGDSVLTKKGQPTPRYDLLQEDVHSADSVLLLSHHSPNMPVRNPKTGGYYKQSIPLIVHDTINYETSAQERRKLNKQETAELLAILILPAIEDTIKTTCFQPRNAVVIFKGNKISCFDFCFSYNGFATYGTFRSDLVMNSGKYQRLLTLFKKYDFKYELE